MEEIGANIKKSMAKDILNEINKGKDIEDLLIDDEQRKAFETFYSMYEAIFAEYIGDYKYKKEKPIYDEDGKKTGTKTVTRTKYGVKNFYPIPQG